MLRLIKWDAYGFYHDNNARLIGREWILPAVFIWENLQEIVFQIRKYGMTYGSGDYGINHLGDTSCCCGIDKYSGFNNWFKGNFSNIFRRNRSNYKFKLVENNWLPSKSIKRLINSNCRLENKKRVLDYLRKKWNSPSTVNAPDSFLGVYWSGDYDEEGNCIYCT